LFQTNAQLASDQHAAAIHAFRIASGMILPSGLPFRIDDPAERDAPGVILLALGQRGAQAILGETSVR